MTQPNIFTICSRLNKYLERVIENDGDPQSAQRSIDELVKSNYNLRAKEAGAVLRLIFYPYGSPTLVHGQKV
ncbi:unnamed protein product [Rotaria sp. Silwood2]|nr:unnamed protein product [Rotaria sp. Silwood2]CAF4478338.1 unnamed protein product [Rotaria sp. Silwood2]